MVEGYSLALPAVEDAGSEVDLAALVGAYSALLFRVAHSVLRSRTDAEDVVQDTFLRALRHRHKLAGILDHRVWLIRIAWNLALDRRRRIRPDQMDEAFVRSLIASATPADHALQQAQHVATVLREIDRLPKVERRVLLLSAVDELRPTDIAAVLGKSDSAIRALLFRARTRLRDRLARIEKGSSL